MEIEVLRQINSRWSDGRSFAAMPGRRLIVDDSDLDAVAHLRHLVAVGDAVEINPIEEEPAVAPEMADKTLKPARKSTAAKAASDE